MNISFIEHPQAQEISYTEEAILVQLVDDRMISAPLIWFPKLSLATKEQLNNWELLGEGEGIHWPELDEDLSIAGLLAGTH
jgi:hypothetical protein